MTIKRTELNRAIEQIGSVLLGKDDVIRLACCCLLSKGHLLIEDLPGVGKTTLSHALASVFGLDFARVQFTSDLLPADILGLSLFNKSSSSFEFKPGPIFSQLLLADEINRATPKAQSALLEAMAEGQVTSDGVSHTLPEPFFVVATQNPEHHGGTFMLPESQLDRFSMRLSIGYPSVEAERKMLLSQNMPVTNMSPVLSVTDLLDLQASVANVHVDDVCIDYIQRLITASRNHSDISLGLSPRAALTVVSTAKAWAYLENRDYVRAEDVHSIFSAVSSHRMRDNSNQVPHNDHLSLLLLEQTDVFMQ